ncbi:MAG: hypothetical protein K5908_01495, partial [Erysipelotrichaceae bacterium]|nr:hypothetical protein [Erysipelotrichaceae bacterium]
MAKRKEKEYDQEQIRELDQIILALATVYGPIDVYELIDKIRFYFPKQYKYLNKKELYDMIMIMADNGAFYFDKAEFVSMFSEEEIDELLSIREIRAMFDADFEKVFEDPDE